jgi:hypothetical protein
MSLQQAPPPSIWPDAFTINFKSGQQNGKLYYDWTQKRQRIDHTAGAYECVHFYNTSHSCQLIFTEHAMWAVISFEKRCCKDLDVGVVRPTWLQNATFLGTKVLDGVLCNHWGNLGEHEYYDTQQMVHNTHIPCKFTFPNPLQDMNFVLATFRLESRLNPHLFDLPDNCKPSCK